VINTISYHIIVASIICLLTTVSIFFAYFLIKYKRLAGSTNSVHTEQKISECHYKSLFEHNPYIVFTVNNEGIIEDVNAKGSTLLKLNRNQLIAKSMFSLFKETDQQVVKAYLANVQHDSACKFELPLLNGNGASIPMFITFIPIIVDETLHGLYVVARDNTELVNYKAQMKQAQLDLTNTMQMQEGLTLKFTKVGNQFIHTLCEGKLLHKLGYTSDMVVGKTLEEIIPIDQVDRKLQAYTNAWSGEIANYEATVNGIDYYMTLSPVFENGQVLEVIGSLVDITARRRAEKILETNEKFLKNILNQMSESVVLYNEKDEKVVLNDNVYKLLDISKEDYQALTLSQKSLNLIREDGTPMKEDESPTYLTLKKGINLSSKVVGVKLPEKTTWLSVNTKRLDLDGTPTALITMSDITLQKEQEIKLKESHAHILLAKEEADKANMAKSDFLSKMSHELRTPLNGILGFSQLLEIDSTLTSQQNLFVKEILKGGRHLLSLINEILDLSRIETGKLKISSDNVDIGKIIDECVNLIRSSAEEKRIEIRKEHNHYSSLNLYTDQVRLKQVILNLLENAVKYNRYGGQVTITSEMKKDAIVVHVRDTGIGIPIEEQSKIFEPFYRIENNNSVEGTGIGLALVQQITQLLGGKIGLQSTKGVGSNFWVELPLTTSIPIENTIDEMTEQNVFFHTSNKKILYIEDNPSNLQLVKEILVRVEGMTLQTAWTGEMGVQIANNQQIDLILLDIHLPDMNAFEILERLKSNPNTKEIPVIAISANAMPDDIHQALLQGFKDYIIKPIDIKSFLSVLTRTLIEEH
jgi:PAS domain S-box-containing protein